MFRYILTIAILSINIFAGDMKSDGVWPDTGNKTNDGKMSSAYGPRDKSSSGYTYDFHRGIDIANWKSFVYSFYKGKAKELGDDPGGWDEYIVISHGDNVNTLYGHCSLIDDVGDSTIDTGESIGTRGNHIHFSMFSDKWEGDYQNEYEKGSYHPMRFLPYNTTKNDNTTIENFILDRENSKVSFRLKVWGDILNCNCVEATLVNTWGNNKEGNSFWYEDWAQYYYDLYNSDLDDDTPDCDSPIDYLDDFKIQPKDFDKSDSFQEIDYTVYFIANILETDSLRINILNAEMNIVYRTVIPMNPFHISSTDNDIFPESPQLHPLYPNPFNCSLTIPFDLGANNRVNLKIYDINGHLIRDYGSLKHYNPGYNQTIWDGKNQNGLPVSSGEYLIQLQMQNHNMIKKVMLLK